TSCAPLGTRRRRSARGSQRAPTWKVRFRRERSLCRARFGDKLGRRRSGFGRSLVGAVRRMSEFRLAWGTKAELSPIICTRVVLNIESPHHFRVLEIDDRGLLVAKPLRMACQNNYLQGAGRWAELQVACGSAAEDHPHLVEPPHVAMRQR